MKTIKITYSLLVILFASTIIAQDRTTVNAMNSEISDNLDLRAVASIFGEAENLVDFERQLNDPKIQISNLDLNNDNQVDYLRVIESVEVNTHLIVIQSVLGRDTFQDVATIEVEKDNNNQIQIQVVGDVYMYGANYIYEPVYVQTPNIYTNFWAPIYQPYCSIWYWDYYPIYYYSWNPCPVFRYRNYISYHINSNYHYNYVNVRRSQRAIALHQIRRTNYCERQFPNRSFASRNNKISNRYELDKTRTIKNLNTRDQIAYTNTRNNSRENQNVRSNTSPIRENSNVRENQNVRNSTSPIRENSNVRENQNVRNNTSPIRENSNVRENQNVRNHTSPIRESNNVKENQNVRNNTSPIRENSNVRENYSSQKNSQRKNNLATVNRSERNVRR